MTSGPAGDDRFGMLAGVADIPGIQLDKDILMKLDPEVGHPFTLF